MSTKDAIERLLFGLNAYGVWFVVFDRQVVGAGVFVDVRTVLLADC